MMASTGEKPRLQLEGPCWGPKCPDYGESDPDAPDERAGESPPETESDDGDDGGGGTCDPGSDGPPSEDESEDEDDGSKLLV